MRAALLVVAGLALAGFLAVAFVMPSMAGSKAKEAARALIAGAEVPKQQVAAAAEKGGKLEGSGAGIKVASSGSNYGELQWIVSENGIIRAWNRDNALEITIVPALQSGKTSWSCRGYPMDAMPPSCGGKS
jgi:hypothetical protein